MGTDLWTWSGRYFGSRDGDDLWTRDGRHVGRFYGNEVYGRDGFYLGEIMSGDRLITHISQKGSRQSSFTPSSLGVVGGSYANYVGYVMVAGYEDFPRPEDIR